MEPISLGRAERRTDMEIAGVLFFPFQELRKKIS